MSNSIFSASELTHYARQLKLPELGLHGQKKLKNSRVLVVGAGGLGCPVLLYLAAAGIGCIGIVEDDVIDQSNLHRQVLYNYADVGKMKAAVAREKLSAMNPHIDIAHFETRLTADNVSDYVTNYDVIVDATDNFITKYLINDACYLAGKPLVYAAISQFEGQIAVFNFIDGQGEKSGNLRDIFPEPPPAGLAQNCSEAGVLGVLPGIVGGMQAVEVIKVIAGLGRPLTNRLAMFDALGMEMRVIRYKPQPGNPLSGDAPTMTKPVALDYQCAVPLQSEQNGIRPQELERKLKAGEPVCLIDVRSREEHMACSIGGTVLSAQDMQKHIDGLDSNVEIIVYCKSGMRSSRALENFIAGAGSAPCRSLIGGLDGYIAAGCTENLRTGEL